MKYHTNEENKINRDSIKIRKKKCKKDHHSTLPDLTVLSTGISIGIYTHNSSVSILLTGSRIETFRRKNSCR